MNEKTDKYLELLHPEFQRLKPEIVEQLLTEHSALFLAEKQTIENNIEEIEKLCKEYALEQEKMGEEVDESKIMMRVFDEVRINLYFNLLHPEFELLSPEEQKNAMKDKEFITKELEKIHMEFQKSSTVAKNSQYYMRKIFNKVLSEKYFNLLHPHLDIDYQSSWKTIDRHEEIILENIEQIDKLFRNAVQEKAKQGEEVDESKIMIETFNETRVNKYFSGLYPDFEELSSGEQEKAILDKKYILEHVEEIDEETQKVKKRVRPRIGENIEGKIVREAFNGVLEENYLKLLFQGYEELNSEEQDKVLEYENVIYENIEEIHSEIQTRIIQTGEINEETDKYRILKEVIEVIRTTHRKDFQGYKVKSKDIAKISEKDSITSSQIEEAQNVTEKMQKKLKIDNQIGE